MQLLFLELSDSRLLFIKNHALDEIFYLDVEVHGAMINYFIGAIENLHSSEKYLSLHCDRTDPEKTYALMVCICTKYQLNTYIVFRVHLTFGKKHEKQ